MSLLVPGRTRCRGAVLPANSDATSAAAALRNRADSALLLTNFDNDLTAKIDASQNNARRGPLELPGEEFARRALFDPIAQSQELLFALVRPCPGHAFQIIHRLGADGASYLLAAIHHGKQHHHPIMFETSDAAAFKCHLVPLIFVLPTGD